MTDPNATKGTQLDNQPNNESISRFMNFSDHSNPYRIDNGDNPAVSLVTELLTADNYASWSKAMSRALRAKNKLGFINGVLVRPTAPDDPLLEAWERCNDLVVSWLQNSVSASLKSSLAFVDVAHEIWTELRDRFTQQNGPRIFQLKKDLASLTQGSDPVNVYYGKLKALWDELSVYDPIPECNCGQLKVLLDRFQRDCVIQFLMGLTDSYANVRDQIMLTDPLPPVNKVFSMIQQQERHYQILSNSPSPDTMVLLTRKTSTKPNTKLTIGQRRDRPYCSHCKVQGHSLENCFKAGNVEPPTCTHCHMSGHMADKCYKLHGYPPGHKFHTKPKGSVAYASQANISVSGEQEKDGEETVALTKTQYQQLMFLLQPKDTSIALSTSTQITPSLGQASSSSNPSKMSVLSILDNDWTG